MDAKKSYGKRMGTGFTLAELIVVIAVLAVLATVAFLSLSEYANDARTSASKANVRSIHSAIATESASTVRSPRYFIVHDDDAALSSSAIVIFESSPISLSPWAFGTPGTNYSAGLPDYGKLRLDPEKFRISSRFLEYVGLPLKALAADDAGSAFVGAADIEETVGGKTKVRSYAQTAAIFESDEAFVVGDYPSSLQEGSAAGLLKNPSDPSGTGALVDGMVGVGLPACPAATVSDYSVPGLQSGTSAPVTKNVPNGTFSAVATCSMGSLSIGDEVPNCLSGHVPSWTSCVPDVCGGSAPGTEIANAESNASSQSVSGNWHFSETPGLCTFACSSQYSWDGSACRANCPATATSEISGLQYALSNLLELSHNQSASLSGTHSFGTSPANGTLLANFDFSCDDGSLSVVSSEGPGSCQPNYLWNSSRTAPTCTAMVHAQCGTAAKNYANSASGYGTDTFCAPGNPNPVLPAFPSAGGSTPWTCLWSNGGNDIGCSASRSPAPTTHTWTAAGTYNWTVPAGFSSIVVTVKWAGGGGGGGRGNCQGGTTTSGSFGTVTRFNGNVTANAGGGGAGGMPDDGVGGAWGSQWTASGGETNTTGGGNAWGGTSCGNCDGGGNGGAGGRAIKTYLPGGELSASQSVQIVVGSGGGGGIGVLGCYAGTGQPGSVSIVVNY